VNALVGIRFGEQIEAAAKAHGLEPRFLAAVAAQETGGPGSRSGSNVVGDHGHGRGLFQIDDRYHAFARTSAAMDPAKNSDYAAGMLSGLLQRYHGDARAALSAYNSGSPSATGTVTTWADGAKLGYAESVLRHYASLGGDAAAVGSELAANRADTAAAAGALAGLAASTPSTAGGSTGASTGGGDAGSPAVGSSAASSTGGSSAVSGALSALEGGVAGGLPAASGAAASTMAPLSNFQITLPAPTPYPTQYRTYTSVSGLDPNQPQQIDSQMTGLIDGADGVSSNNGG